MSFPFRLRPSTRSRRGFSLTEGAIVLGILSFLLAATWKVVVSVRADQTASRFATQIAELVVNIQDQYSGSSTFAYTYFNYTPILQNMGSIFPADMLAPSGSNPLTPWGTGLTVRTTDVYHFYINFSSFPSEEICRKFIGNLAGAMSNTSLYQITVGTATYTATSTPVLKDLTGANANGCSQYNTPTSIYFKLKG